MSGASAKPTLTTLVGSRRARPAMRTRGTRPHRAWRPQRGSAPPPVAVGARGLRVSMSRGPSSGSDRSWSTGSRPDPEGRRRIAARAAHRSEVHLRPTKAAQLAAPASRRCCDEEQGGQFGILLLGSLNQELDLLRRRSSGSFRTMLGGDAWAAGQRSSEGLLGQRDTSVIGLAHQTRRGPWASRLGASHRRRCIPVAVSRRVTPE
jgi:hypothetical protein